MKSFRVKIFKNNSELISSEVWEDNDVNSVSFWVEQKIQDIIKNMGYKRLRYEIEEV